MTFPSIRSLARPSRLLALALPLAAAWPAAADEAARALAAQHLEAGTLAAGEAELAAIVDKDPANDDARFGLGVVRFVSAVEGLSQGLYHYGLQPPRSFMAPVVRLPVPYNPAPASITYDDFQGLIATFVADLDAAEATLAAVKGSDVRLDLDLGKIRYDANGDGTAADDERFLAVVAQVTGMGPSDLPQSLAFSFDKGDVLWLEGYCNVITAMGNFILAHDWRGSFDASFHHFFPRSQSAFAAALDPAPSPGFGSEGGPIADFISFIHIPWTVIEPERMLAAHADLKQVIALSRASWAAIEAETDDNREWLPNPRQKSPFESIVIDAAQVAAWQAVLGEAEAILDGKKLLPHWRFRQGVNLKKMFTEPRPFDLVLLITGPAALPYLENGPITTAEDWDRMVSAFGDSFGVFALWAN